jgi:hypothetical protein
MHQMVTCAVFVAVCGCWMGAMPILVSSQSHQFSLGWVRVVVGWSVPRWVLQSQ